MAEKVLLGTRKLVIAPVAEISVEPNGKQLQIAREVQVNSLNLLVFEYIPAIPRYAPPPDISENEQANTQLAAIDEVSARHPALDIVNAVTDLHARKSSIMQNQRISKKSARCWPKPWQNFLQSLSVLLKPATPSLERGIPARTLKGNPQLWRKVFHRVSILTGPEVAARHIERRSSEKGICPSTGSWQGNTIESNVMCGQLSFGESVETYR